MTLEQDLENIKGSINRLLERPLSAGRTGLYIMVAITMCNSCGTMCNSCGTDYTKKIYEKLNKQPIAETLEDKTQPSLLEENVLGGPAPEKYYVINGDNAYIRVDGKPIDYLINGDSAYIEEVEGIH